jgi:hypothetical protein
MQEYAINAQYKIYMNCPKKTLKEGLQQAKGAVRVESIQIRWFLGSVKYEVGLHERQPKVLKTKLAQVGPWGHQARIHSDQMVLVMAKREAGPHERWPKTLKGSWKKP